MSRPPRLRRDRPLGRRLLAGFALGTLCVLCGVVLGFVIAVSIEAPPR